MDLVFWAVAVATSVVAGLARLWWVLRERTYRRREAAWMQWWIAYRRRLPAILMARWPRNRTLAYRPDAIS